MGGAMADTAGAHRARAGGERHRQRRDVTGHGWRDGLRADAVVKRAARTMVPVLAESEWYRAERDRTEVVAALVPIEQVWVETIHTAPLETAASGGTLRSA